MFRNWVEVRAYMIDRQRKLVRDAEISRERALSRANQRLSRKKDLERRNAQAHRPEVSEGDAF